MALMGAPCCFIFQVSLFQANGNLRGNYVYNWGRRSYGLCIRHETTKLTSQQMNSAFAKRCTRQSAAQAWAGRRASSAEGGTLRKKTFTGVQKRLLVTLTAWGTHMRRTSTCRVSNSIKYNSTWQTRRLKSEKEAPRCICCKNSTCAVSAPLFNAFSHRFSHFSPSVLTTTSER